MEQEQNAGKEASVYEQAVFAIDRLRGYVRELERQRGDNQVSMERLRAKLTDAYRDNEQLRSALVRLKGAVKDHPDFQAREYVQLGIEVNNALTLRRSESPQSVGAVDPHVG